MAKPLIESSGGGGGDAGGGSSGCRGGGGGGGGGSKAGTTFVQADSTCFRDLVQRLTGPSGHEAPAPKPTQKLHERRKYKQPNIEIASVGFQFQPEFQMISLSSPVLGYPASPSSVILLSPPSSLHASPISTPVSSNKRASPSAIELNPREEEKAIKEKRFYLHPSPRSKQRLAAEPELLTLFPLTSPTTSTAPANKNLNCM